MKHRTKNKGDLGVLKAQVDLAEKGFTILIPLTEHAPFDIVVYKDGVFKTVQVKYRSAKKGKVEVKLSTCWTDRNGTHIVPVDRSVIDMFCIYCPDSDECYYIDPKTVPGKSISLRVEPPKNNQKHGVNLASDFRDP